MLGMETFFFLPVVFLFFWMVFFVFVVDLEFLILVERLGMVFRFYSTIFGGNSEKEIWDEIGEFTQMSKDSFVFVFMGVSGCGKSSIGKLVGSQLSGFVFFDGDDFHSDGNKKKMNEGLPLTDDDRNEWLDSLSRLIGENLEKGSRVLLACSALKKKYRDRLRCGSSQVYFVHLKGDFELIESRLNEGKGREGHFFSPSLLASQFEALEDPKDEHNVQTFYIQKEKHLLAAEITAFIKNTMAQKNTQKSV